MAIIPGEIEKNIIIETPEKQKTKKLLAVLLVILVLTGLVVYLGFFSASPASPGATEPGALSASQVAQSVKLLEALKSVELNNPIFTNKKFGELIFSDRLPVTVGEKGRVSPFSPF